MSFTLHERIEADSVFVADLPLCQIRLINNATYPWALLIPRQDNIKETIDLSDNDQQQLMKEIALLSKVMQKIYSPDKLNIAGLGNMVPQLHMHVIARFKEDPAWPNAIWGTGGVPYAETDITSVVQRLKDEVANA